MPSQQQQLLMDNGNSYNRRRSHSEERATEPQNWPQSSGFPNDAIQVKGVCLRQRNDGGQWQWRRVTHRHPSITDNQQNGRKTVEAQRKGAKALAKWAERSNNNAMSDVVGWSSKLFKLCADKQTQFAKDQDHFLKD